MANCAVRGRKIKKKGGGDGFVCYLPVVGIKTNRERERGVRNECRVGVVFFRFACVVAPFVCRVVC